MNNENLRPFKPGQSGNPAGRPKTSSLKIAIRSALDSENTVQSLVQSLIAHAKRGNMQAMRLLLACTDPTETPIPDSDA